MFPLVAFSPDGKRLVSSSFERTLKLWDLASGQALQTFKGHPGAVHNVAFNHDGKGLTIASIDGKIIHFENTANGQAIKSLKGHTGYVRSVAFSSDGKRLASAGDFFQKNYKGEVLLWDTAGIQQVLPLTLKGQMGAVNSVAFSSDGKLPGQRQR